MNLLKLKSTCEKFSLLSRLRTMHNLGVFDFKMRHTILPQATKTEIVTIVCRPHHLWRIGSYNCNLSAAGVCRLSVIAHRFSETLLSSAPQRSGVRPNHGYSISESSAR